VQINPPDQAESPARAPFVLTALIVVAAVANLNLAVAVFFMFPKRDREQALLEEYGAEDTAGGAPAAQPAG